MDSKALGANTAYLDALKRVGQTPQLGGAEAAGAGGASGSSFADMLQNIAEDAIKTTRAAETTSLQAVAKQADLVDVVTAVSNAETTLESVVAVRDRVVQAYQDILRMPI